MREMRDKKVDYVSYYAMIRQLCGGSMDPRFFDRIPVIYICFN